MVLAVESRPGLAMQDTGETGSSMAWFDDASSEYYAAWLAYEVGDASLVGAVLFVSAPVVGAGTPLTRRD